MALDPFISTLISSIVSAVLETAAAPALPRPEFTLVSVSRVFPSVAMPGRLYGAPKLGKVMISGKTLPTAPGLQIRDQSNRIVLPTMVTGVNLPVLYQMDATGANVWRIWILTPQEISAMNFHSADVSPSPLPAPLY
jgi:hypothetical protein